MLNRDTGEVRLPMTPLDEASVGKLRKTRGVWVAVVWCGFNPRVNKAPMVSAGIY